jgi:hypothetical protein
MKIGFHGRAVWLWIFVASALSLGTLTANAAKIFQDVRVQDSNAKRPQLVFACDRKSSELEGLFTPQLISDLKELNAGVALSLEDFSPVRAKVVQELNAAGIPMTAWIVLPRDQGYYVNVSNPTQTAARFAEFDKWTQENNLRWVAVGLDIEPNFEEFGALSGHKLRLISFVVRRAMDGGRVERTREAYAALIRQMQSRGYPVQTYQLVFIAAGREAHTTLLERIFGMVNVRGDDEVLMIYTSFTHQYGAAPIWHYGPTAQSIAVGSTALSGDAATDAKNPPLNWEEFSRDLIVAHHFSPVIGVYSLEGCVTQGFMPKLKAMDWTQAVVIPADSLKQWGKAAQGIHSALWVGSHALYLLAVFVIVIFFLVRSIVRWRTRKRAMKLRMV